MADFRVRTPAIDPQAFANVLQRKSQMEQEQVNTEIERKQGRLARIMAAVQGGQQIASNMMSIAEKRQEMEAKKKVAEAQQTASNVLAEPTTLPPSGDPKMDAIMSKAFEQDRSKRLLSAFMGAEPKETTKALLDQQLGTGARNFAPQSIGVELKNGKIIPAIMKNGLLYYPNTDTLIPPGEIVGKGHGLKAVQQADGSVVWVSPTTTREVGSTSTKVSDIPEKQKGTVTNLSGLEKIDREHIFKTISETKAEPLVLEGRKALKPLQIMRSAIENNDRVLIDRMGGLFHKAATSDVGNLAAYEQRDPNSRAIFDRIKNSASLWVKGTPSEDVRKQILSSLDTAQGVIEGTLTDTFNERADMLTESFPQLNRDAVLRQMGAPKPKDLSSKPIEEMTLAELEAEERRLTSRK